MKINLNTQNISFTAGKVKLYSDFDGTYFPTTRSNLRNGEDEQLMKTYSSKMDEFFKSTKGDLDFHITTGRDFASYKSVSEFLKEKGYPLPYPESFITNNGSCEYIKLPEAKTDIFPFSTKNKNIAKQKGASKLTDTLEAFKTVFNENDLLIVAGNRSNDYEMLNPLEYIRKDEWETFKSKSAVKNFYDANMDKKLADLKDVFDGKNVELKKQLEADGFLKKIEDLPLKCIVVKSDNSDLKPLVDTFEKTGKVIEVEKGSLDKGVKDVVKSYAEKNSSYKQSMSDKFKDFIYKSGKNKIANMLIPIAGLLLCGGIMAMHYSNPERSFKKKN